MKLLKMKLGLRSPKRRQGPNPEKNPQGNPKEFFAGMTEKDFKGRTKEQRRKSLCQRFE